MPHRLLQRDAAKQRRADAGDGLPPRARRLWNEVRGLRRCGNKACARASASFVDRDFNAAVNILRAFQAADRGLAPPPHMRKAPSDDVRTRAAPALFFLVPVAAAPAGARDGGRSTHVRRAAARADAGVDPLQHMAPIGRRSPHRAFSGRTGTATAWSS